jgi:CRP-like cAMP-binding protein
MKSVSVAYPASRPFAERNATSTTLPEADAKSRSSVQAGGLRGVSLIPRGGRIFGPEDGADKLFVVRSGCIRLYKVVSGGRSVNLGLLGPNTIFTQERSDTGMSSGAHAVALTDSTVISIPFAKLAGAIVETPELAAGLVCAMTQRLTELQTLVEHLLARDASVRLASVLLDLATRFGGPLEGSLTRICYQVSHRDLAAMIGSNRVTVTRSILEFQELGLARSVGRNSLAVDEQRLREFIVNR